MSESGIDRGMRVASVGENRAALLLIGDSRKGWATAMPSVRDTVDVLIAAGLVEFLPMAEEDDGHPRVRLLDLGRAVVARIREDEAQEVREAKSATEARLADAALLRLDVQTDEHPDIRYFARDVSLGASDRRALVAAGYVVAFESDDFNVVRVTESGMSRRSELQDTDPMHPRSVEGQMRVMAVEANRAALWTIHKSERGYVEVTPERNGIVEQLAAAGLVRYLDRNRSKPEAPDHVELTGLGYKVVREIIEQEKRKTATLLGAPRTQEESFAHRFAMLFHADDVKHVPVDSDLYREIIRLGFATDDGLPGGRLRITPQGRAAREELLGEKPEVRTANPEVWEVVLMAPLTVHVTASSEREAQARAEVLIPGSAPGPKPPRPRAL